MAGNHLTIGQGIGESALWNTNPAIKAFTDVIAQQRAQRLANQQALLEQAGKINPNGIREPDKQDYLDKYNDWKQSAIQANNLPQNSRQRMDALFDAQSKFGALNQFIGQSKQHGQYEHQLATSWASNPHLFADNAHDQFIKSMQSPMSGSDYVAPDKYLNFERYIDPEKIKSNLDKANEIMLKQQGWSNPIQTQTTDKQGNKTGVVVHNERSVPPETLLANHFTIAKNSSDQQKLLDQEYPDLKGDIHAQVLQLLKDRGDLAVDKNGQLISNVGEKTKPEFKAGTQDLRYTKEQQWFLDHYGVPYNPNTTSATSNQPTPAQTLITNMQNGTPGSGEKLLSLAPKGQYGKAASGMQQPHVGVDNKTGEHVFAYPPIIDPKVAEENKATKARWAAANPGIAFDPTDPKYKLKNEVAQKEKTYRINPASPNYLAEVAQMAKEQNINLSQLNQIEGIKGGHGQIEQAKNKQPKGNQLVTVNGKDDYDKLPKGAHYIFNGVEKVKK